MQQYGSICQQLTNTDAENLLLPIFLVLCGDSIWSVRKECADHLKLFQYWKTLAYSIHEIAAILGENLMMMKFVKELFQILVKYCQLLILKVEMNLDWKCYGN